MQYNSVPPAVEGEVHYVAAESVCKTADSSACETFRQSCSGSSDEKYNLNLHDFSVVSDR